MVGDTRQRLRERTSLVNDARRRCLVRDKLRSLVRDVQAFEHAPHVITRPLPHPQYSGIFVGSHLVVELKRRPNQICQPVLFDLPLSPSLLSGRGRGRCHIVHGLQSV